MTEPHSANSELRVKTLQSYEILDTPQEPRFDDLATIASNLLETDCVAIAFFDETKVFLKSVVGPDLCEIIITNALANLIIANPNEITIIENLATDVRLPRVSQFNEVKVNGSLAAAPIVAPNGTVIGAFAVIDSKVREFSLDQTSSLQGMARQVMEHMESRIEALRLQEILSKQQKELQSLAVADRIARTLLSNVNTPALFANVMNNFAQAIINEFGWWAAQVWRDQSHELVPGDFIIATSAPRAISELANLTTLILPIPDNQSLGLEKFGINAPALVKIDSLAWHPRAAKLMKSGARDFIQLEVAGLTDLAVRIIFILPSSRSVTPENLASLNVVTNLIPQFVRRARSGVEMDYIATHDHLTGIFNRRGLEQSFSGHDVTPLSPPLRTIFFFDLDKFKTINDTYGHSVGDQLLIEVTSRLIQSSRPVDLLARLGGDEFVMISQGFEEPQILADAADRILADISKPFTTSNGVTLHPRASIGISFWDESNTLAEAISQADAMMYDAKNTGGNKYSIDAIDLEKNSVGKSFNTAREYSIKFLDIFDSQRQEIIGIYANISLPGNYAPAVIKEIAQELMTSQAKLTCASPELLIEVDSAKRSDRANVDALFDSLKKLHKVRLLTYVLDIRATHADEIDLARHLREHQLAGVAIANFGSGFADISHLQTLRPDYLLFPQEFIPDDNVAQEIAIRAVAAISKTLGIPVIAPLILNALHNELVASVGILLFLHKTS